MNFRVVALFIILISALGTSRSQGIHLIIVGDTKDASIGSGVDGNVSNVRSWFSSAAKTLAVPYHETVRTGGAFGCEMLSQALDSNPIAADDAVIFYYSGHGYRRESDTSVFPSFFCGPEVYSGESPGLSKVAERLTKKGARLVIAIADTCNVTIAEPASVTQAFQFDKVESQRREAYRNLILRHRGTLIISSSSANEFSWYYPTHGIFTRQFMRSLEKFTQAGADGTWNSVLVEALNKIKVPTGSPAAPVFIDQTPQVDKVNLTFLP